MSAYQAKNAELFKQFLERSNVDPNTSWYYRKFKADGYMDLSIDRQGVQSDGGIRFAMAHNGELNGDLMADPDMEIILYPDRLVAWSYQNDWAGYYTCVDQHPEGSKARELLQISQDEFLNTWLSNLLEQGHLCVKGDD